MISPVLFIMYVNELAQMLRDMCPGLYVSEQYPSVHILMYADDLTLVNDTVGRVQNELNVLNQFCQNYGMTMNLKKSKVIAFRNGGYLRQNERFYYGGQLLNILQVFRNNVLQQTEMDFCSQDTGTTGTEGIICDKVSAQEVWWASYRMCLHSV